ncbi:MAG: hypothetical protein Q9191_004441 [Dirinaria sp. TL-2023a]
MPSRPSNSSTSARTHINDIRPVQTSPTLQPFSGSSSHGSANAYGPSGYPAFTSQQDSENSASTTLENSTTASARERLVGNYHQLCGATGCNGKGSGECEHGALSPHAPSPHREWDNPIDRAMGNYNGKSYPGGGDLIHGALGDSLANDSSMRRRGNDSSDNRGVSKIGPAEWLARPYAVKGSRKMYFIYYFPFMQWTAQYKWSYLRGDAIAALTMASFYLPMSLSLASNLGHIPPINGLYSYVFNPIIYALLGSCPQLVVGPEAAGSLLVGQMVKIRVDKGTIGDEDQMMNARVAGVVTGMAGAVIFIAGLTRLGFLDSVLSRPFLRGFISAVGFVILVDQLIPELGLSRIVKHVGSVAHGSSIDKIIFLSENLRDVHGLTASVSFASFAIIMVCRYEEVKKRLQPRYPTVAYLPDRFIVVILSALFTWKFGWHKQGLEILGDVRSSTGSPFPAHFPFVPSHMGHVREAMSTSFLIGLLGFFESSVAAKSLGGGEGKNRDGLQGMALSANRELVALGVANIVGGCFMALPAFGGYGRSKKAVLSSMISVVAYSLVEEAPHDIKFFVHIRGWPELMLMFLIFAATIFYSLTLGIALGVGLSLLSVIRHATKPRIQILGKVPGTDGQFENAEANPEALEFIEGCLIVKIPEPLTFANTGDLKSRLRRLELYGTTTAHPALPRVRDPEHNQNIIFDVHGVTGLDGSGTQVLAEIVDSYISRGARVFFCRVPKETSPVFASVLHFTLSRRGGAFSTTQPEHDWVNLTYMVQQLERTECRYSLTKREAKGNKLVRKAKADETGGKEPGSLMGDIAANGTCALGLAPSAHLKQTQSSSFISQLLKNAIIERPIFSLMLVNGQQGVLSIGGTAASAVDLVTQQTRDELDRVGALEEGKVPVIATTDLSVSKGKSSALWQRGRSHGSEIGIREVDWRDEWKWSHVQGAEGWWQMLMQGVWVDGSRVLQNQAAVIDINSPFILAPPHAAKAFYASMSGSHPLPFPYSNFYAFPCLNPPALHFEFAGASFPAMHGGRGADWSDVPGGRFSLGRLENGSGYCVGSVVETAMGIGQDSDELLSHVPNEPHIITPRRSVGGNGMRDVSLRYALSYITFHPYSRWARFSYRTAFVAAAATYGIVVYKAFRARARSGSRQQGGALAIAGDENVQYLGAYTTPRLFGMNPHGNRHMLISVRDSVGMALVWLFSRQIPLALLPFMVYSIFHVATYSRTNLLPTLQPPQQTSSSASPGGRPTTKSSPTADTIGRFVKEYYDASMMLVATLELSLWFRILFSAIILTKGSWILLVIYTVFIRARYSQSSFVQGAVAQLSSRVDAFVAGQSTPPVVRQGWDTLKNMARRATDQTDINRYAGAQQPGMKKAQ